MKMMKSSSEEMKGSPHTLKLLKPYSQRRVPHKLLKGVDIRSFKRNGRFHETGQVSEEEHEESSREEENDVAARVLHTSKLGAAGRESYLLLGGTFHS